MEIHFPQDIQAKLDKLASDTGRTQDEFVQDAMAGYLEEPIGGLTMPSAQPANFT